MFYFLSDAEASEFQAALETMTRLYPYRFAGDMLIAFQRNLGFLADARFLAAYEAEARTDQERSLAWRLHVLCWCALNAMRLEGDFVECGVYRGFSTSVVARYVEFGRASKRWHLYDTFDGIPADQLDAGQESPAAYRDPGLHDFVVARFAAYPNIRVHRGRVPQALVGTAPDRIAFLHLDMNSSRAEFAALEALYEKLVPGAWVVLDDYGWLNYREQKVAADAFFGSRGVAVLELPTGQGLAVKPLAPASPA